MRSFAPLLVTALAVTSACCVVQTQAETPTGGSNSAAPRITRAINPSQMVPLAGNVRHDLGRYVDLGAVDDSLSLRLTLVLQRSPQQQARLDNLVARQLQPTAPEYHQWLTPQQFGEQFGLARQDIEAITAWIEDQRLQVDSVLNNGVMIVFTATARDVREVFHADLHSFEVDGKQYPALVSDPVIPAALESVVVGISGLNKIPPHNHHTPIQQVEFDEQTHTYHTVDQLVNPLLSTPRYTAAGGQYNEAPQDFYTIYDVQKLFTAGYYGQGRTVAVPEPTDMHYGTPGTGGVTTGGDVATFRKIFGVPGTLKMIVEHGSTKDPCTDPGITNAGDAGEATLDAEWSSALAPDATLVFMSCDSSPDNGFVTATAALIDDNVADVIGLSWGNSELVAASTDFTYNDTIFTQAAAQGQTIIIAAGDSGSDTNDQNTTGTASSGLNIDAYADNPLVVSAGGLDFQDLYDSLLGGSAQTKYWKTTNSTYYESALSYVPETIWNGSCASSIQAEYNGGGAALTPAAFCAEGDTSGYFNGAVVGGAGGYSAHYAQPLWQAGVTGLSSTATKRAIPDIALFASNGIWNHSILDCDSDSTTTNCSSTSTFGGAGGTSYVAPQLTGIVALLDQYTGTRQGLITPALYALAKTQFTATATKSACYANGQTSNIGVTTALPAAACIFHDVTTSNNDVPCVKGTTSCYVETGKTDGLLSSTGATSLTVAYSAGPGFDLASGLGSIDVYNLATKWNQAFTSTTALAASPAEVSTVQTTTLTATVKGGLPKDAEGSVPPLTGKASFATGTTSLGSCTLFNGTCSITVKGSAFPLGIDPVTATFSGSPTYPASTSSIVDVSASTIGLSSIVLTFLPTVTGNTSVAQTVTITNSATTAATLSSISLGGANPTSFVELNNCTSTLAAGASCAVTIAFAPATVASFTAQLNVADNAAASPQTVKLSGSGVATDSVTLSATSLTFGSTVDGTTSDYQAVTVTNKGAATLNLTSIAISGAFTELNTCSQTLAPSASCVVYVAFKPTTVGTLTGAVTITDTGSGSPQKITLTGTGVS